MNRTQAPVFNPSCFSGSEKAVRKYQAKYAGYFHNGQTVLDIGCGEGVFLELLNRRSVRSIGIDHSDLMIARCRKKNLNVVQSDALQFLKRVKGEYDGIFCAHLIEHFQPEHVIRLVQSACNALKPGGLFIVITPNIRDVHVWCETFWLDVTHVRPYPLPLLEEFFRFAGFDVVQSGEDSDTGIKPGRRNFLDYFCSKIRFGSYYGKGDSFVVGRKKG
jgi:SAM-dependent methyltransferase